MNLLNPVLVGLTAVTLLAGCGNDTTRSQSTGATNTASAVASFPADLFTDEPILNAASLLSVKESAKPGDEVSFVAAIGGRANPFIDGRAVMVVSDLDLAFCTDGCPVPWDACCAPGEDISKLTAMVQVVDETGNPLRVSLAEKLKAGTEIQVSGFIDRVEEGNYVINAHRLHIAR